MVASVQPAISNFPQSMVRAAGLRFEEDGAGTYTGTIELPAYAFILDIIVHAEALWAAATSASLVVGDDDDADGWYTATNLKATDLLAGESLSLFSVSNVGAYVDQTAGVYAHIKNRIDTAATEVTATITSVGAGTTGRTDVIVIYAVPELVQVTQ